MSDDEQRRARDALLASEGLALSTVAPQVSHVRFYPETASEPVVWRILCTTSGATGYLYTEKLPFDPGPGVKVRREPEPLFVAPAQGKMDCGEAREKEITRLATIEECAQVAEAQKQAFLSPEYASNQPFGSLCERFACDQVAEAIRALSITSTDRASPASHTHACRTCCGDGYINIHANLPDVKCEDCNGTGRGLEEDPDCRSHPHTSPARGDAT